MEQRVVDLCEKNLQLQDTMKDYKKLLIISQKQSDERSQMH